MVPLDQNMNGWIPWQQGMLNHAVAAPQYTKLLGYHTSQ